MAQADSKFYDFIADSREVLKRISLPMPLNRRPRCLCGSNRRFQARKPQIPSSKL